MLFSQDITDFSSCFGAGIIGFEGTARGVGGELVDSDMEIAIKYFGVVPAGDGVFVLGHWT